MNDAKARLTRCFAAVFPTLDEQAIASASAERVEAWDSVAAVTLVSVIGEEFGIEIDGDAVDRFVSFQSILDYLREIPGR